MIQIGRQPYRKAEEKLPAQVHSLNTYIFRVTKLSVTVFLLLHGFFSYSRRICCGAVVFFSYFYIIFVFVFGLRLQCDFLNIRYKRCCLVQITLPQHNTHYHFLHYILWSLCFHSVHLSMYVCLHAVFYQLFFSNVLKISEQRKKKKYLS